MTENMLTLNQTAELIGIHKVTLRQMIHRGDGPPAFRIGRRLLKFNRREVDAWLRSRRLAPANLGSDAPARELHAAV